MHVDYHICIFHCIVLQLFLRDAQEVAKELLQSLVEPGPKALLFFHACLNSIKVLH